MPVEVKELIVRAIVEDHSANGSEEDNEAGGYSGYNDQETIIAECVKQVMKIIKQSKSR